MTDNPYDPPTALPARKDVGSKTRRDPGVLVVTSIMILAVVVSVLAHLVPAIRTATMPRFGWVGLLLCLNPLIFLVIWFRMPVRRNLLAASFMTFAIGLVNAMGLWITATVSSVDNEFTDRLHSSWLWSVVPFFVVGGYLCWRAFKTEPTVIDADGGEQTDTR